MQLTSRAVRTLKRYHSLVGRYVVFVTRAQLFVRAVGMKLDLAAGALQARNVFVRRAVQLMLEELQRAAKYPLEGVQDEEAERQTSEDRMWNTMPQWYVKQGQAVEHPNKYDEI